MTQTASQTGRVPAAGIQSMTGFASVSLPSRAGTLVLELRSVNSRFLDIQIRMPDDLRPHESIIREQLSAQLQRGKVECRVAWVAAAADIASPRLHANVISQLAQLQQAVQQHLPDAAGLRVLDVLNWPGVLESQSLNADEMRQLVAAGIEEATAALVDSRKREGERLIAVLTEKVHAMQAVLATLEPQLPLFLQAQADKITARLQESLARALSGSPLEAAMADLQERIRQEVGIHQVRVDVSEEFDRLKTHFGEILRVLRSQGPAGKRLDFLTQELNREANTLGSKSPAIEQTQTSIELKVLIEQLREQVQNLE